MTANARRHQTRGRVHWGSRPGVIEGSSPILEGEPDQLGRDLMARVPEGYRLDDCALGDMMLMGVDPAMVPFLLQVANLRTRRSFLLLESGLSAGLRRLLPGPRAATVGVRTPSSEREFVEARRRRRPGRIAAAAGGVVSHALVKSSLEEARRAIRGADVHKVSLRFAPSYGVSFWVDQRRLPWRFARTIPDRP